MFIFEIESNAGSILSLFRKKYNVLCTCVYYFVCNFENVDHPFFCFIMPPAFNIKVENENELSNMKFILYFSRSVCSSTILSLLKWKRLQFKFTISLNNASWSS
mgnify:CR=1 FL=1